MENDSPIRIPQEDRLDRFPFAEQLATGLIEGYAQSEEALVVGIHGPWGSGKSSLVNLMVRVIRRHYYKEVGEKGIVLTFNPWMFSGQQELQLIFLRELAARLYAFSEETRQVAKKLYQLLSRLEALAKPITPFLKLTLGEKVVLFFQQFGGFVKQITGQTARSKDVESLKKKIDDALKGSKIRLYITIDDIDRLTFAEIEHIFQLVKLNANFANTVFVLAYDQEVVVNALDQKFAGRGQQYLEKIVQVDYGLPKMNRHTLKQLLRERMGALLKELGITPSLDELIEENPQLWGCIEAYIRHIRDINRYLNAVRLRLKCIWEDIDIIDFLALEVLRVLDRKAYDWIWMRRKVTIPSLDDELRDKAYNMIVNLGTQMKDDPIDKQKKIRRPLEKSIRDPKYFNLYFKLQH